MFGRSSITVAVLVLILSIEGLAGNITGKINFAGPVTGLPAIKMNADPKCIKMHGGKDVASQQVVANPNKTLQNVFVYVKNGLEGKKFPTPTSKITIEQQGCMYHPHVFGMMANQPLEIINSDATLHNIHSQPKNSKEFNIAQPMKGMKKTQTFSKAEVMVKIKCDVHSWMAAYIGILDHPFYAVSDDKGSFTIKNLPPGEYELEAWHEKFGTKTMKVTVGASDTKTVDFSY